MTVDVRLRSNVPVDHLELILNGRVIRSLPLSGDRRSATTTVRVPVDRSGWLLLRARGDKAAYPILDIFPYATTSPIYLTVGGKPARSPEDARYFHGVDRPDARRGRGPQGLEHRGGAAGCPRDARPGAGGVRATNSGVIAIQMRRSDG